MLALVIDKGSSLQRDYPAPAMTAGESIVRVRLAGICGTDLELAKGYMDFRGVPGHEFVGEVVDSANASILGRRVVGEINAGCAKCLACVGGLARHCANRTVLGILGRDGAFAEYLRLPDRNLIAVPDSIPDEMAVFVEPLAAAYEIFEQIKIPRNRCVLVLGDGRLGILVALAMKAEGYDTILAGHHPQRAEQHGITAEPEHQLSDRFEVVVDCTGSASGFIRAVELVRPRGTVILKSTAAGSAALNLAPVVIDEITVLGSRCGRFAPALEALASRKIDPRPLISATFSLEEGAAALEQAANPSNLKVLLKPS